MSSLPVEVVEAGERLVRESITLIEYLDTLVDYHIINSLDVAVVDMLSSKTGVPMRKTDVAEVMGSDLKYIRRCVRRVTDILTMFDDSYQDLAYSIIGVAVGKLELPEEGGDEKSSGASDQS